MYDIRACLRVFVVRMWCVRVVAAVAISSRIAAFIYTLASPDAACSRLQKEHQ